MNSVSEISNDWVIDAFDAADEAYIKAKEALNSPEYIQSKSLISNGSMVKDGGKPLFPSPLNPSFTVSEHDLIKDNGLPTVMRND